MEVLNTAAMEASVGAVSPIRLDLAKKVFWALGGDASGRVTFRKNLKWDKRLEVFAG